MAKGSTKYQLLKDDFDHAVRELKLRNELIADLRKENEKLKDRIDTKIIFVNNDWEEERYVLQDKVESYEKALRDIDTHIRATTEPVPYIVQTLLDTLPQYDSENC
ncbi:hypothetical protein [Cytobacillus firmus]|uniref:hypothetical protein n=1 Tax=Cytobacillus firmus TaxID=1399 RepID=UPI0018CDDFDF|nr:hypothetical protein [Cytobacillus firmus]MBG9586901.1 hypothetical protein [Cytobacillus firmus]